MKLAISAQGESLDAQTSEIFGRAPSLIFVDTDTLVFDAVANPAVSQGGGAGTSAAQIVISRGADMVKSAARIMASSMRLSVYSRAPLLIWMMNGAASSAFPAHSPFFPLEGSQA